MATSSTIWIKTEKGFRGIYCHFDGYNSGVGEMLRTHYTDKSKIENLINLGSLSYLEPKFEIPAGISHSFNHPAKDITVAYHRDRGEDLLIYKAKDLKTARTYFKQYNYIFDSETSEWKNYL